MFKAVETLSHFSKRNILVWLGMTFQAGAINAGAFLSCQRFVTHTTGLATGFGTELAQGHVPAAIGLFSIPFCFMLGAMMSGYFVDHRIQKNLRPMYHIVMGTSFIILALAFLGGINNQFGNFGEIGALDKHYILLVCLSFACGLQNGTVTSSSGSVIRITHMTGLTTDLGIGIMRVLTHTHEINSRKNEIRANLIRAAIFMTFSFGALISTPLYLNYGYWGFALPTFMGFALFIGSIFRFIHSKNRIQSAAS